MCIVKQSFVNWDNLSGLYCSDFFVISWLESEMFIGYFDETKRNITVEDQKSIGDSYINEHKINAILDKIIEKISKIGEVRDH